MGTEPGELHVVFFPFMAYGHMIPTLDVARLFAARDGVKATIITTPLNVATFKSEGSKKLGAPIINIEAFRFPAREVGLPEGFENLDRVMAPELIPKFFKATQMLREQLEQYLEKVQPNCLVADMFFPWTTESAAKFNIPRLVFHGTCSFSLCVQEIIRVHEPFKKVLSNEEPFILPHLPHEIPLTRSQISEELWTTDKETEFKRRIELVKKSEVESYGVIVNSFYELEPDYADYFKKQLGRRAWNIGPVSLSNRSSEEKVQRGKQTSINEDDCLKWLDSKMPNSVIYICFGSTASFIAPQLREIAIALESSGQNFIWVIRHDSEKSEEWMPTGFGQRMEGKGLLIRGWAPQVLILEHEAIGAFVTHCGWNSTLEGISAGVPMVTWPIFAEQFYNEKLVTLILKTGVPVGAHKWSRTPSIEEMVKREAIEKALTEIIVGKEAKERRDRAKRLKVLAHKAVEVGGSSYSDLSVLINELRG